MGRMLLKGLIGIGISLCVLQNSWAISIEHLGGEIFASSSTNDSGSVLSAQQSGFTASGTAVVDTRGLVGGDAFGFASGFQISPAGADNEVPGAK